MEITESISSIQSRIKVLQAEKQSLIEKANGTPEAIIAEVKARQPNYQKFNEDNKRKWEYFFNNIFKVLMPLKNGTKTFYGFKVRKVIGDAKTETMVILKQGTLGQVWTTPIKVEAFNLK